MLLPCAMHMQERRPEAPAALQLVSDHACSACCKPLTPRVHATTHATPRRTVLLLPKTVTAWAMLSLSLALQAQPLPLRCSFTSAGTSSGTTDARRTFRPTGITRNWYWQHAGSWSTMRVVVTFPMMTRGTGLRGECLWTAKPASTPSLPPPACGQPSGCTPAWMVCPHLRAVLNHMYKLGETWNCPQPSTNLCLALRSPCSSSHAGFCCWNCATQAQAVSR